ncbi:hypothetical protein GCM10010169_53280 [Micromonospora fulviviridis]|uniref:hypothetical protein n=1 Tax=Micromonospora fulviviridis TaxID=47860 RepID=UPI00166BCE39|nr:hypothetical protein [Micromonospora fulviviridis]GGS01852.1 hypothetical protein GCM10010169_53280 [Micromonospora fulviviridis]
MTASLVLLAAGSTLLGSPASAAAGTKVPLQPAISFPNGDSVAGGGQIAVRFDANGDTTVTGFRYSIDDTELDSQVSVAADGTASVTPSLYGSQQLQLDSQETWFDLYLFPAGS